MATLTLTAYKPNLKDPRVQKRVASVLAWVDLHLSPTSPQPVHHDKLRSVFGTPTNPLSAYLRANLLCQVGTYIPGQQSLSYTLNKAKRDKLEQQLHQLMVTTSGPSNADMYPELATLEFTYSLKSDRYWHPLQNIKREKKADLWRNHLPYSYDTEACAPTILFQCASAHGLSDVLLEPLRAYLDDRTKFRSHVATLTGLSLTDSKKLINSLFNGARLAANSYCSAFRLMGYDEAAMARLKADPQVKALLRNIKAVWSRLELVETHKQTPTLSEVLAGTAKPVEKKLKTSAQKWSYYFARERRILDSITDELRQAGIKHFTEHDGFRTDREIDVAAIQFAVKTKTGFDIKLKAE
ncbi:hypothetical protein [Roseateles depolymerans]|uniref:Uncharacterized protein n=1 Tax=Roseateles depolymerans TaxID=76731 RepID=A0A0U3MEZ1_9BURK|nr:hypothetical protein [Roseateles depolymerans]ALV07309.1 hypothetical protein RD2015_2845 [Roseateles depolymerans]REG20293.1 hypothetical protein DES44_2801 [Roseateles depolymerans]